MFKNREISVHVSKANKDKIDDTPAKEEVSFNDKVATAMYVSKVVAYRVGAVVAAYVVLDTWRQVSIAKNTTNIVIND